MKHLKRFNEGLFDIFKGNKEIDIKKTESDNIKDEKEISILIDKIKTNIYNLDYINDLFHNNLKNRKKITNSLLNDYIKNFYDATYHIYKIVRYEDRVNILSDEDREVISTFITFLSKKYNKLNLNSLNHKVDMNKILTSTYYLNRIDKLFNGYDNNNYYYERIDWDGESMKGKNVIYNFIFKPLYKTKNYNI